MLAKEKKRELAAKAHSLNPVVMTGAKGITENLVQEMHAALEAHELIKVRVNAADRDDRQAMVDELANLTQAEHIKTIGHVAIFYRKRRD
ncbi:MAG: ribosome assembly RNA-binding protein YhbY [Gammaproteobacteria bacterium CG11_big_fil_rev_8_21_14_0_20_46_22]|nr:MAG: ribosome assembly RNA-binding protein YhbY [Gammaproteobacteria bacterium CG12_big_fil_rev_8_21_14_0_65_46_12]PIR11087.1 MAG: ribosome assembly RNA-binding protein YhbY [Gammaproteobacteria bacterium CG11_big_fil_rev_8_21_14_0_20_46_22]